MPTVPAGYTHIEEAPAKWDRGKRNWWYEQVKEGRLTGYTIPGFRGTYLRDEEVEEYLKPKPIERDQSAG